MKDSSKHNLDKRFRIIYRAYKSHRIKNPDLHIDFCVQQENLLDAIEVATKSIDQNGKIHNHQRRVGKKVLDQFAERLIKFENEIKEVKDFNSLYNLIKEVNFPNIGSLTVYDVSTRIGAYMNIFPDKIYLHAGTKEGAKYLLKNIQKKDFIELEDLPKYLLKFDLTASEFEDILCIFKKELKELNL